jgi:hypothetical protein
VERLQTFDRIDPYAGPHPILIGLEEELRGWGKKTEGVVETLVGNCHGSLELRVIWKKEFPLESAAPTFLDIPVRNVHSVSEEEMQQLQTEISLRPIHRFSQALFMGVAILLIPVTAVIRLFIKKKPNNPSEPMRGKSPHS